MLWLMRHKSATWLCMLILVLRIESKALSESVQKLNAQGLVERVGRAKNRHQASQACYLQKQNIYRNKEQQQKGNGKKIMHLLENLVPQIRKYDGGPEAGRLGCCRGHVLCGSTGSHKEVKINSWCGQGMGGGERWKKLTLLAYKAQMCIQYGNRHMYI